MADELKTMTTPKRMLVGGRMMSVWLSDFDASSGSYNGFAVTVGKSLDVAKNPGNLNGIEFRPVRGARPYPYTERPSYSFQFVEMGEDEAPLLAIGQGNADAGTVADNYAPDEEAAPPIPGEVSGEQDPNSFDPRDTNRDGTITNKERKEYNKKIENQRG
jgi:hypothetical protein